MCPTHGKRTQLGRSNRAVPLFANSGFRSEHEKTQAYCSPRLSPSEVANKLAGSVESWEFAAGKYYASMLRRRLILKIVMTMSGGSASDKFISDLRSEFPDLTFVPAPTPQEQLREIVDADVLVGLPSREVFLAAKRLQWIHETGTGIDRIMKVPELVESDVILTNALGPHANPMADHVFALLLSLTHRLPELREDQKARRWDMKKYSNRYVELTGRTMGILALGGIGMAVARRARGFGMNVYAVDIRPLTPPTEVEAVWGLEKLDELLRISDVFVITAPYTAKTHHLIDRRRIGLLKPTAYVIAISRGGIIEEEGLIDALRDGRIAGAGLDSVEVEPLPQESPLWDFENVVLSPHASAITPEMYEGRRQIFKENLRRFLAKEPFLYVCDKKAGF